MDYDSEILFCQLVIIILSESIDNVQIPSYYLYQLLLLGKND